MSPETSAIVLILLLWITLHISHYSRSIAREDSLFDWLAEMVVYVEAIIVFAFIIQNG